MTSNGGLSRRRVPAGGSSSTPDDDEGSTTSKGSWSSPNATSNGGSGTSSPTLVLSHAGSAFEGGSKIAFDPRDIERDNEDQKQGGRIPRLTLMEEVLLLGLKDKQVNPLSFLFGGFSLGLRRCVEGMNSSRPHTGWYIVSSSGSALENPSLSPSYMSLFAPARLPISYGQLVDPLATLSHITDSL
jgi:hypothetical protein